MEAHAIEVGNLGSESRVARVYCIASERLEMRACRRNEHGREDGGERTFVFELSFSIKDSQGKFYPNYHTLLADTAPKFMAKKTTFIRLLRCGDEPRRWSPSR